MAVDSLAKRFSMFAFARGPNLPIPDGTIAAADRATLLWLYGGITLSGAAIAGPYSWEAGEVFQAGAVAGEVWQAGSATGETFQAGSATGEVI